MLSVFLKVGDEVVSEISGLRMEVVAVSEKEQKYMCRCVDEDEEILVKVAADKVVWLMKPEDVLSGRTQNQGNSQLQREHLLSQFHLRLDELFDVVSDEQLQNFVTFFSSLDAKWACEYFIIFVEMARKSQDLFQRTLKQTVKMVEDGEEKSVPWSYWFACRFDGLNDWQEECLIEEVNNLFVDVKLSQFPALLKSVRHLDLEIKRKILSEVGEKR